jgi:hypothetical protein
MPEIMTFRWISHDLEAIYFQNPKCASMAIREFGFHIHPKSPSNPYNFKVLPDEDVVKYPDYFKFGICRNPWDRAVSVWKMFTTWEYRNGQLSHLWKIKNPKSIGFQEFCERMLKARNHHWEQQIRFVPFSKYDMDYVGNVENFEMSWKTICRLLGIKHVELPMTNLTAPRSHYSTFYNEKAREIVDREYAADIQEFGYNFEEE